MNKSKHYTIFANFKYDSLSYDLILGEFNTHGDITENEIGKNFDFLESDFLRAVEEAKRFIDCLSVDVLIETPIFDDDGDLIDWESSIIKTENFSV